ncbi:MAG TPA: LysR family transcriptional regulator substrate-binding protein, partial [Sporolactobacillaceae bacterium]|nr:LysR family transcriptional regulator substrate-binding protein [Sporolactobacillaceae bacterium]
ICSQMGVQPPLGLELEFNDSVHSFVAQDHGVSIVPEMAAKGLKHPDLIVKPIVSKFAFERSVDIVFQNEMEKILNQVIKKEEGDPEGEL